MAGALVLISHDRRFLETLSRATIWLDRGETHRLEKGFAHFEAWRDEKLAQEETERHKLERRIAEEEHWVRYGVTARRKRNVGRLERLRGMRKERRELKRREKKEKIEDREREQLAAGAVSRRTACRPWLPRPGWAGARTGSKRPAGRR